jgi:hypothetical protein
MPDSTTTDIIVYRLAPRKIAYITVGEWDAPNPFFIWEASSRLREIIPLPHGDLELVIRRRHRGDKNDER